MSGSVYKIAALILIILAAAGAYFFIPKDKEAPVQILSQESEFSYCAWLPWWDYKNAKADIGLIPNLDTASPFIYTLEEDGSIKTNIKNVAKETNFSNNKSTKIIPSIYNNFDGERVSRIINSQSAKAKHIKALTALTQSQNYDGIELDYEYLLAQDKDAYSDFVADLADSLHSIGKKLVVTLHPKTTEKGTWYATQAQDWEEIAKRADKVRIMAYDFHWEESGPGPLAPIDWYEEVTEFAKSKIPDEKIIMGLGLYGYNWQEGEEKATPLSLAEIDDLAKKRNLVANYDQDSESPYLSYTANGDSHEIWFENTQSIIAKKEMLEKNNITNICIWRLGGINDVYKNL